ncbi:hypothetical protein ACFW04_001125 [Cataglyphis niger]
MLIIKTRGTQTQTLSVAWIIFLFILNSEFQLYSTSGICDPPIRVESNIAEPWLQPCGIILTSVTENMTDWQQRHKTHKSLHTVRTSMRVANHTYFTCFKKEMQDIHQNFTEYMPSQQYKFDWLPKGLLKWYCKDLLCLGKEQKAQYLLPYLYNSLQRYAITFHELKKFRLNSNVETTEIIHSRNRIIEVILNQILQMMCEVQTAMYKLQIDLPPPNNITIITSEFWSKEGGVTQMLVQDWGVLKMYKDSLKDWLATIRNALNNTLPVACQMKSHNKNFRRRCVLRKRHQKWLKLKKRIKPIKKQFPCGRHNSSKRILRRRLIKLE